MLSILQEFLGDCFYDIHMKPLINILEGIFDKTHDTLEDDVALGIPEMQQWLKHISIPSTKSGNRIELHDKVLSIVSAIPSPSEQDMVDIGISKPIPKTVDIDVLQTESVCFDMTVISPLTMCPSVKAEALYIFAASVKDMMFDIYHKHDVQANTVSITDVSRIENTSILFDKNFKYTSIHFQCKQLPIIKKFNTNSQWIELKLEKSDISTKLSNLFDWNEPIKVVSQLDGGEMGRDKWTFKMFINWFSDRQSKRLSFKQLPTPKFSNLAEALKIIGWDSSIASNPNLAKFTIYWEYYRVSLIFEKTIIDYTGGQRLGGGWILYWS